MQASTSREHTIRAQPHFFSPSHFSFLSLPPTNLAYDRNHILSSMDKKQVTELVVPIAAVLDLEAQGKQDFAASDITQNLSPPEPKPGSGETQFPPKITKSGAPTELRKLKDGSEKGQAETNSSLVAYSDFHKSTGS
jgi:hypothetical protein